MEGVVVSRLRVKDLECSPCSGLGDVGLGF